MRSMTVVLLAAISLPQQAEEDKALEVFKTFNLHLRNGDFSKAATCLHPKSLVKLKGGILKRFGFEKPEDLERRLKSLGFATWEEAEKAEPADIYVRYMKKRSTDGFPHREVLARDVESIVGTLKKGDRVYIVVETKFTLDWGATRDQAVLYVAYKDGGAWKLATEGESNIDG